MLPTPLEDIVPDASHDVCALYFLVSFIIISTGNRFIEVISSV